MSVTFFFEGDDRQQEVYPCQCLDMSDDGLTPHPECWECKGTGKIVFEHDVHSVNFSNTNARIILELLGQVAVDDECLCGEIGVSEIPSILRQVLKLTNTPGVLAGYAREFQQAAAAALGVSRNGPYGPMVQMFMPDEEGLRTRLTVLARCLQEAQRRGANVHFG